MADQKVPRMAGAGRPNDQHTPGPWTVHEHAPWSVWCGETQIAACRVMAEPTFYRERRGLAAPEIAPYFERNNERAAANARLIAAAPDLLAALRVLANLGDASIGADVRKALRPHERADFDAAIDAARAAILKAEGA